MRGSVVCGPSLREPLVPFNASGEAAAPMNAVIAACKSAGLWHFAAGNRLQITPSLVISEDDFVRWLDIIDEAPVIADGHVGG